MKRLISRRALLRGLVGGAAVSVGLPALELFLNGNGNAYAGGDAFPRRFGIFYWGNGNLPDLWDPKTEGADWELTPLLQPLAAVKKSVSVVTGMKVYTGNTVPHGSGPVGMLSGSPFPIGDTTTFAVPSIDQVIASQIGTDTRFKSLEFGVQPDGTSLSYNGPHSLNPPETSPIAFFNRIFGPGYVMPGSMAKPDPKLGLRTAVLDAVKADAQRLEKHLGAADKARLEQHLDGVATLEKQIQKLQQNPPSLAACGTPVSPMDSYPDIDGRPALSDISRAMVDIIVMALACDQTRVFSDWFSSPVDNLLYPKVTAGHHQLTHDEPAPQPQVASIVTYIMNEFAYLVSALGNLKEGDGSLLDHTVVLATSDVSYGKSHSVEDYPILLAGSAGGALKPGLHYHSPSSENTSKVLLTLVRAMGLTMEAFGGGPGQVTTSLSALEA